MSKKDKIIETIEVEDASLLPELLDGKHHVIPIVTGDLVAAGHDGDHAVIAVEQIGKQVHVFDFDCFEFIFFTHSLQIYNVAKVTIF